MTDKIDTKKIQTHVGKCAKDGSDLWHTDSKGKYWCGNWYDRTPEQLMSECLTTMRDLLLSHPKLNK